MVYRFIFISDEVDDFYREIQISSSATFLDFSNAILKSVGYPDDQMTSFFMCEVIAILIIDINSKIIFAQ